MVPPPPPKKKKKRKEKDEKTEPKTILMHTLCMSNYM